jgi:hypothetical protein
MSQGKRKAWNPRPGEGGVSRFDQTSLAQWGQTNLNVLH